MDSPLTVSTFANEISSHTTTLTPPAWIAASSPVEAHAAPRAVAVANPAWKRALDVSCICVALPVLVLVMLGIAGLIKLLSPGPVLFQQPRVGHRGVPFMCLKFRSMKVGANCTVHQQHVTDLIRSNARLTKMDQLGDPRLIPGGAFLRASGLDELPQVINVWRGEMSLVGPRPCMPYELQNYTPAHHERFDTLPGLTGLWQVSGKNRTTFSEMVALDISYVRNRSFRRDVTIMAKTFSALADQVRATYRGRRLSPRSASPERGATRPTTTA